MLKLLASYAYRERKRRLPTRFQLGEGLVGQCALREASASC